MRGTQLVALVGIAAVTITLAGTAAAQAPATTAPTSPVKVLVAKTAVPSLPRVFIDTSGTVNVVWLQAAAGASSYGYYARKPAGATHFTRVPLPNSPTGADSVFIYSPSHGELQIIEEANDTMVAWRSTNDGKSWRTMDLSALNALSGYHINTYLMNDSPGGPVVYAGSGGQFGGPVVQLNKALTTATTVATNEAGLQDPIVARSAGGTTYQADWGTVQATVRYQAGTATGTMVFPTCPVALGNDAVVSIAAGKTVGVVVESACGHTWAYTISPSGALSKRQVLGTAYRIDSGSAGGVRASVVADRDGHFTAAWTNNGGDTAVSRSSDGKHWTAVHGAVPTSFPTWNDSSAESLSTGSATWEIGSEALGASGLYAIRGLPLSSTYTPPPAPSAHGIAHPKRAHLGSLAATVPGKVALKPWRKSRKVTFRLVDALADHAAVTVSDIRTIGPGQTTTECTGHKAVTLKARHAMAVTVTCVRSGGAAKKGDLVQFAVSGRNGTLTVTAAVR